MWYLNRPAGPPQRKPPRRRKGLAAPAPALSIPAPPVVPEREAPADPAPAERSARTRPSGQPIPWPSQERGPAPPAPVREVRPGPLAREGPRRAWRPPCRSAPRPGAQPPGARGRPAAHAGRLPCGLPASRRRPPLRWSSLRGQPDDRVAPAARPGRPAEGVPGPLRLPGAHANRPRPGPGRRPPRRGRRAREHCRSPALLVGGRRSAPVQRQLLLPLALPHLGMLPTVLRKIVLRLQPGTGQFLVTRPARARWRDSIGGNVPAHHRVSCPVHAGARHAGDLVDHHGLYGTGCRRRRRAPDTGH